MSQTLQTFQTFHTVSEPGKGAARLAALRGEMARRGVDAFVIPRADAHQGEYVAPSDERLAWLTGFTGSAGLAIVLAGQAAIFTDGRYRIQVRTEVDVNCFTPIEQGDTLPGAWLAGALARGQTLALDPWLHTVNDVNRLRETLGPGGVTLRETDNLVDAVWHDRPAPPNAPAMAYPRALAGRSRDHKRADMAAHLGRHGLAAMVLTLPDSICWLLNIRGNDIPRVPVVQAFAILFATGRMQVFCAPAKLNRGTLGLDETVQVEPTQAVGAALAALEGTVGVDFATAPMAILRHLQAGKGKAVCHPDPCQRSKACKTHAEIEATRRAHLRDAVAMARFLAWLDAADKTTLTEIAVVQSLERFRRDTGALRDIAFDTICGSGPHGAIVHYRVNETSNRALAGDRLLLVDSGAQYLDGTTDVTRTVAIGPPRPHERRAFTRVLQGMIALSRARFPKGVTGAHLDALARAPLWLDGLDYDHGTGHGVGHYLAVHEGPQRFSRTSDVPLEPGMVLSNEPGHYVAGEYGIRIENLVVVRPPAVADGGAALRDGAGADVPERGDDGRPRTDERSPHTRHALPGVARGDAPHGAAQRAMMSFETLTWVPIDRRLIDTARLGADERDWVDTYHRDVAARVLPEIDKDDTATAAWVRRATAPL